MAWKSCEDQLNFPSGEDLKEKNEQGNQKMCLCIVKKKGGVCARLYERPLGFNDISVAQ